MVMYRKELNDNSKMKADIPYESLLQNDKCLPDVVVLTDGITSRRRQRVYFARGSIIIIIYGEGPICSIRERFRSH